MSQREIATARGISQAALSQQLTTASDPSRVPPGTLVEAAGPCPLIRLQQLLERVLGRRIDLVDHGGATPWLDHDTRRDAVSLVGLFGQAEGVLDDVG